MILNMIEGKMDTVLALIESKLSNVPGQAGYCCKCCVGCKCPCCDHVILDILNLQDLTLETLEYKGVKLAATNDNGHLIFPTQFPDWKPISMAESASTEHKPHELLKERLLDRLTFITKWDKEITDTIENKKTYLQDFVTETADPSTTYRQEFLTNTAAEESTFWHDFIVKIVDAAQAYWQDLITKSVSAEKTYWQEFFMTGYRPGIDFIQDFFAEAVSSETSFHQNLSIEAVDEQTVFCKDFSLAAAEKETTYNKEFAVTLHTLDIFYLTEYMLTGYETEVMRETTFPAKQLIDHSQEITLLATKDYFQDFTLRAIHKDYVQNFRITAQGGTQPPPPPPPPKIFEIVIIRIDPGIPLPHGFFVTVKAKGGAEELMTGKQFSDINTHTAQILQELGAATYSEIILTIPQSAFNAGSYTYNLNNSFILERMIFITIQPDVHVYRQEGDKQINLVHTEQTLLHSNPLAITKKVIVCETPEAKEAKNIALTESNQYSQKVFIESNLPIDLYGTTLSSETSSSGNSTWLRLQEKIRLTRRIRNSEYQWHDGYGSSPIIQTDALGMYVRFMSSESNGYETSLLDHPYCGAVELGLEKPFLDLPISVEADVRLYLCESDRYTGTNESTEKAAAIELPLHVSLKTLHAVKISPPLITLDEDNNYTSFLAVEANDGAAWSFETDERISVTPASGTGRAAVIVRKADSFELVSNFERVELAVTSTVDAAKFSEIDGEYKVITSAEIHIEKYQPEHNALIPRMVSNSCDGITIVSCQKNPVNELNGDFAANAHHASYAITSADDVLQIDTVDSVVLDKMELTGTNVRRTIETGVGKGGAAVSFSLFAANDLSDVWTLLRNGDTATDIAALSGTTTAGQWQQSNVNVTLTNTGNFSYRYYKLVPINRSSDQEISLALHRINLFQNMAVRDVLRRVFIMIGIVWRVILVR